jgi:hypothetical protein
VVAVAVVVLCALFLLHPRTTPLAQLSAGYCVDDAISGAAALASGDGPGGLHIVPCFDSHDGEIYATGRVPDDVASDPAAARQYALEFCTGQRFVPIDSEVAAFDPNGRDLANGDRAIVCVAVKRRERLG